MRIVRVLTLLLTLLALNNQALAFMRAPQIGQALSGMAAGVEAEDAMHMDCCDPDAQKNPCDPLKNSASSCNLCHGGNGLHVYGLGAGLMLHSSNERMRIAWISTPPMTVDPQRLLRPPIS